MINITINKNIADIIYHDKDYQIIKEEDGSEYIKYFNEKYKFWVKVKYNGGDGLEKMKNTLKKIALDRC